MASVFGSVAAAERYNLTLAASIRNALNNVNPATPIGNLHSRAESRGCVYCRHADLPPF